MTQNKYAITIAMALLSGAAFAQPSCLAVRPSTAPEIESAQRCITAVQVDLKELLRNNSEYLQQVSNAFTALAREEATCILAERQLLKKTSVDLTQVVADCAVSTKLFAIKWSNANANFKTILQNEKRTAEFIEALSLKYFQLGSLLESLRVPTGPVR